MHAQPVVGKKRKMRYIYLGFLLGCAIWDIKIRKIPAVWLYGGLIWMGIYGIFQVMEGERGIVELLTALVPGVFCFIFGKISESMGEGDSLLILGTGFCFIITVVLQILMLAFFLAAIGSMILLILKRNIKNRRIPFVPYLLSAFVVLWMGQKI